MTRLRANPQDYIGKEFVISGAIAISDYYNFGFSDSSDTHYSFKFIEVDKDFHPRESGHVYLSRPLGRGLAEWVTKGQEDGFDAGFVSLKCTVDPVRIRGNSEQIDGHLEVIEWRFMNTTKDGWGPWVFDGFRQAFQLLARSGEPGMHELVKVITDEKEFVNRIVDTVFRSVATKALSQLDDVSKRMTLSELQKAFKRSRSGYARMWAQKASAELSKMPDRRKSRAQPTKSAGKSRAASLLQMGQNLEKNEQYFTAQRNYEQILKDYPDSPEAAQPKSE